MHFSFCHSPSPCSDLYLSYSLSLSHHLSNLMFSVPTSLFICPFPCLLPCLTLRNITDAAFALLLRPVLFKFVWRILKKCLIDFFFVCFFCFEFETSKRLRLAQTGSRFKVRGQRLCQKLLCVSAIRYTELYQ